MNDASNGARDTERMIDENATELHANFNRKHAELVKATEGFARTVSDQRSHGREAHAVLWNACLFINLAAHDLSVLVQELTFRREDWLRRYHARQVALIVYEVTEDLRAILGKTFREALTSLGMLARFEPRLATARKPLEKFWDDNRKALQQTRVIAAAHRDHDGLAVLREIQATDWCEMMDLGMAFQRIVNDIATILQEVIKESATIQPPGTGKSTLSGSPTTQLSSGA